MTATSRKDVIAVLAHYQKAGFIRRTKEYRGRWITRYEFVEGEKK